MNQDQRASHLILLLTFSALLFFLGLGNLGLTDRDEGSNAEAAREMLETGDWISPTLNYEPRFAKPVFIYWLMSGAYQLFGASEVTARLHSALFGVMLILLQYLFLAHLRGQTAGLLGALMLLLNVEMMVIGRMALTDSVLIFFTTLALYGFWLGLHGTGRERHAIWLFYIGMGFGLLTKGPIGVAVPLLAVIPYLTVTKRWQQFWERGFPLTGLALMLAIAVPWYAAMLARHGSRYTDSAQADTIGRFLSTLGGHGGTIFFYVPVLLFAFFPWSGFLPVALYQMFAAWWADRPNIAPGRPQQPYELEFFAAIWLLAVFLFFSLSATRLLHYIGPLFPAAAILASLYWQRCLSDPTTRGCRASIHFLMVLGYLLGVTLAAGPALYDRFIDIITKEFPVAPQASPGYGPVAAGVVLVAGSALVGYLGLSEQRRAGAFWAAGATIALVILIAIQITLPHFNHFFISPAQQLAYTAGVNLHPEDRLILYGPARPSLIFYAKRKAIVIRPGEEDKMKPYLGQPGRTMIVLPARLQPRLPPEAAGFQPLLQRYGYSLLASEPIMKFPPGSPQKPIAGSSKDPHARYKQ